MVVSAAASQVRDLAWLRRHVPDDARAAVFDATSGLATLSVMGPRSRALLARATTGADLSDAAFPFGASRVVDLGYARARATRITYVGELGWELYVPTEFAACAYEALLDAGAEHGLRHAGYHALDSLRMEKGYRHWGHDITDEDTPTEAGLGFAVAWDKPGGFLGRDALLRARGRPPGRRLVGLALDDPGPLLLGNEPVWGDGGMAGRRAFRGGDRALAPRRPGLPHTVLRPRQRAGAMLTLLARLCRPRGARRSRRQGSYAGLGPPTAGGIVWCRRSLNNGR